MNHPATVQQLAETHQRIRALITLAHAVSCDETPLMVGPQQPPAGQKKAERYLLVACTELYTHYLLGDRSLDTFTAFVVAELSKSGSVIAHDRSTTTTPPSSGRWSTNCAHLLRDLAGTAEVYPDPPWPTRSPMRCAS